MSIRTFIAVDIGALDELVSFEDALEGLGAELKLVAPENIHITLKFLGDTNEELVDDIIEIIRDCAQAIKPFNLEFEGAGAFPNLNYMKVVWVGLKSYGPLETLAQCLNIELRPLGFKPEKRGFRPHITLARVKSKKKKDALKKLVISYKDKHFAEFDVNNIRLKKSELSSSGPTYSTLGEVKLE
ncbi:RNA 2',3'-cyclic phosphodiesterase [[Eubacterium] cellulosolvens]